MTGNRLCGVRPGYDDADAARKTFDALRREWQRSTAMAKIMPRIGFKTKYYRQIL